MPFIAAPKLTSLSGERARPAGEDILGLVGPLAIPAVTFQKFAPAIVPKAKDVLNRLFRRFKVTQRNTLEVGSTTNKTLIPRTPPIKFSDPSRAEITDADAFMENLLQNVVNAIGFRRKSSPGGFLKGIQDNIRFMINLSLGKGATKRSSQLVSVSETATVLDTFDKTGLLERTLIDKFGKSNANIQKQLSVIRKFTSDVLRKEQ